MAENDVTIKLDVESQEAINSLKNFGKTAQDVTDKAETGFANMSEGIKKFAVAAVGAVAVFATIKKSIGEAVEEENGIRQLNLAIAGTGEFSAEASKSMLEFADSLGEVTGLGDDAIRTSLTLAKSFGITNDQAKELVKAATNLSAVTGQDLDSTVKQLGATLDGSVGKLGNLGAEFRNLTEEQAKNLGVVDLINSKYGEAGEALGQTFSANLARLTKAFDDSFKAIGQEIINDNQIKQLVTSFAEALKIIAPVLAEITKLALKLFGTIVEGLGYVVTGAALAGETLGEALGIDSLTDKSRQLQTTFLNMSLSIKKASEETSDGNIKTKEFDQTLIKVSDSAKKAKASFKDLGKEALKLADEGKKFAESIQASFGSKAEVDANKFKQALESVDAQLKKGAITAQTAADLKVLINKDYLLKVEEDNNKAREKEKQEQEKSLADLAKAASENRAELEKIAGSPIEFFFRDISKTSEAESIGAAIAGSFDAALSGRNGAVQLASKLGASFASEAFGPAFGPVIGSIIGKLAAGPEQAKAFVKEFITAIPEIIVAIVDALPEAISAIVETIFSPEFLSRLGLAMGKSFLFIVTGGLNKFAPEWGAKIAEAFGPELQRYLDVSIEKFTQVFTLIGTELRAFVEALKQPFEPLIGAIKSLEDALRKAGGQDVSKKASEIGSDPLRLGRAIATGGLSEILPAIGVNFAKGGIVPMYAADGAFVPRGTDTVPAMLTPGELVIPRDMVGELSNFLARQSSTTGSDPAVLAAILTAVQSPMIVTAEAKVNQNAFADIILQLNRQNMRLQA